MAQGAFWDSCGSTCRFVDSQVSSAQDKAKSVTITKVEEISIEVVEIVLSNEDVQSLYAIREELKPLGK